MRIVMMGTGTFAEPTFSALIDSRENVVGLVTQPEREVGRRTGASRQVGVGLNHIAMAAGIPVLQPESINTPDGLAALRSLAPDLVVVAAYGQILKPEVIAVPTLGMINVHASLLPRHRGAAPVAYAILMGDQSTGVTIIRISPGLDSGDMLAQDSLEISPTETAGELESRLAPLGATLCLEVVQRMKLGPVIGTKQDPALVTKAPKLTKAMGLIDWSQSATQIQRHVRAMQPFPTAYTFLHRPGKPSHRVIINQVETILLNHTGPTVARFGTPIHSNELNPELSKLSPIAIRCGGQSQPERWLLLKWIQPAGKKRMTAEEFLRGYPIGEGCWFGPEHVEANQIPSDPTPS